MKKVLALVLAVMMMATVAFAAIKNPDDGTYANGTKDWRPGQKINITDSGIVDMGNSANEDDAARRGNYVLSKDATGASGEIVVKSVNSTNYSISNLKYKDGKNLVESVKFNDAEDRVEIKLKQDYSKTTASTLDMTFTLKGKKVGKNEKPESLDIHVLGTVGYQLIENTLSINKDETVRAAGYATNGAAFTASKTYLWKVGKDGDAKTDYGSLEFTAADGDTDVEVRVYKDDKHYLYNDTDANSNILKAYADTDADITFLNFPGEPTFNSTATVYFYKEEDSFVYGVKDGKLVNVNAKWSDDDGAFVLKTRTLGSYVFSDKALNVAATTPGTNNPDTGANDVVGIAGALAAVALVSAAAVSLKK